MPVTMISLYLPMLYAIAALTNFAGVTVAAAIVMLVMAVLFVLNMPVKKPGAKGAILLLVIGLATGVIMALA